ncbi:hypothetical protein CHUAL_008291 [Chamberlinius hualienensis]
MKVLLVLAVIVSCLNAAYAVVETYKATLKNPDGTEKPATVYKEGDKVLNYNVNDMPTIDQTFALAIRSLEMNGKCSAKVTQHAENKPVYITVRTIIVTVTDPPPTTTVPTTTVPTTTVPTTTVPTTTVPTTTVPTTTVPTTTAPTTTVPTTTVPTTTVPTTTVPTTTVPTTTLPTTTVPTTTLPTTTVPTTTVPTTAS